MDFDPSNIGLMAGAIGLVFGLIRLIGGIGTTRADIRRVERKLDRLLEQLGVREDQVIPKPSDRVLSYLAADKTVEAIKQYRDENPDFGLADAKSVIDQYKRKQGMTR